MTEQFKLVTNAQESKMFKTNAISIKIKCSNNFPWGIVLKLPTQAWNIKRKFHHVYFWKRLFPSAKITLQMTHSDWSNLVTHTTCSTLNKNLHSKSTYFLKLTHQESWRSNGFLKGQSQLIHMRMQKSQRETHQLIPVKKYKLLARNAVLFSPLLCNSISFQTCIHLQFSKNWQQ